MEFHRQQNLKQMTENEEDLRQVQVQVATCKKCNGAVMVAVKDRIDKRAAKEFASMMADGCGISLTNVIVARSLKWCWDPENNCEGMWPKKTKKR